ncbi:response regulator receiver protein [Gluconacetobacter diazotrophicus PA1 5]|nr:response regulator [Gluconacetobacter diazotrophicus]ACI49874.1 response regulator receiver protein [Gluconacetobacter diazotrophicus PA1 5]TWB10275.1 response regulator receiver domain-containing protein [Gluconacetobacter diazotrophicus]
MTHLTPTHLPDAVPMDKAPILLVEDDFLIRMALAAYLRERGGFTVVEADDTATALAAIDAQPCLSILLTDMRIPGPMSGSDVAAAARAKWPDLPVLYVTGTAARGDGSAVSANRDSYVGKPFEPSAVLKQVHAMLDPPHGSAP